MSENNDARLAKAAMSSLRVPAPAGLRAELKRLARGRKKKPASIWSGLRDAISGGAWAYGAGAAFAAAAAAFLIARAVPERAAAPAIAERPLPALEAQPQALRDLWADDDGEDNDDI